MAWVGQQTLHLFGQEQSCPKESAVLPQSYCYERVQRVHCLFTDQYYSEDYITFADERPLSCWRHF